MSLTREWQVSVPDGFDVHTDLLPEEQIILVNTTHGFEALNAATGETEWSVEAQSVKSTDRNRIYASAQATLYACDSTTGGIEWEYVLPSDIREVFSSTANSRSVAAANSLYITGTDFGADPGVIACVEKDGTEAWTRDLYPRDVYLHDMDLFVKDGNDTLCRIDTDTGGTIWSHNPERIFECIVTDNLVLYHGYNDVTALDRQTGHTEWTTPYSDYCWTFEVDGGYLYVGTRSTVTPSDNTLQSFDLSTGRERWSVESWNWVLDDFVSTDQTAFIVGDEGGVIGISTQTGSTRWQSNIGEEISNVDITHGHLYVNAASNTIHAYDIETGRQKWTHSLHSDQSRLIFDDNYVYVVSDKTCRVLDPETGRLEDDFPAVAVTADEGALFAVDESETVRAYSLTGDTNVFSERNSGTEVYDTKDTDDTQVFTTSKQEISFCPDCGASLDDHGNPSFCPSCGAKL